ncbi:MAG: hypothetical protein CMJ83_17615 [Planctomycetes bacterium]|nr:hypothetical protein [Planctomycetota bacterium]
MTSWNVAATAGLILFLALPAPAQDMVELQDGRIVSGPKMTRTGDGITVHYRNGEILIPKDMVRIASVTGSEGGGQESLSDEDKAQLEKGLVRLKGRWVKAAVRDRTLKRIRDKSRKKIEEAMKRRHWRNRYKLRTRNFAFEYTINPEKAKEYADLMEVYFKVFTKEWKIRPPSGTKKLKVCFYHDPEYYHQVSGAPRGVIGYFRFVAPKELNFYYERLDERMTIDVMFHETNHYLTHLINPKFLYPSWVNESLAEYYGASHWDPKKKKMSVGHIQEGRLTVIQDAISNDNWQMLEPLIELEKSAFNATHYAWGWSFVHFLLQNKKYAKGFKRFYIALAKDKSIKRKTWNFDMVTAEPSEQIKALKKHLKLKSLDALEKAWHEYIKGLKATSHRGWTRGGALYLSRGMPLKARRFFETAIKMGNKNPITYYNLGRACLQKRDYPAAEEAFRNAIAIDPLNGVFYVRLARCRESQTDEKDEEVRRLKRLALEIDPHNDEVIRMLGFDDILKEAFAKPPKKGGS